jgi:hypothetical protein
LERHPIDVGRVVDWVVLLNLNKILNFHRFLFFSIFRTSALDAFGKTLLSSTVASLWVFSEKLTSLSIVFDDEFGGRRFYSQLPGSFGNRLLLFEDQADEFPAFLTTN